MKIDNFVLIEVIGSSVINLRFRAEVDVTTGFLFKKKVRKEVYKQYGGSWYFSDTGKFTPAFKVEELQRAYEAKHGKPIEDMRP